MIFIDIQKAYDSVSIWPMLIAFRMLGSIADGVYTKDYTSQKKVKMKPDELR